MLRNPALATTDVSSVETLSYGGAPIAPELVHRLLAAFPKARLGNGFGLSETSALATFCRTSTPRPTPTRWAFRRR